MRPTEKSLALPCAAPRQGAVRHRFCEDDGRARLGRDPRHERRVFASRGVDLVGDGQRELRAVRAGDRTLRCSEGVSAAEGEPAVKLWTHKAAVRRRHVEQLIHDGNHCAEPPRVVSGVPSRPEPAAVDGAAHHRRPGGVRLQAVRVLVVEPAVAAERGVEQGNYAGVGHELHERRAPVEDAGVAPRRAVGLALGWRGRVRGNTLVQPVEQRGDLLWAERILHDDILRGRGSAALLLGTSQAKSWGEARGEGWGALRGRGATHTLRIQLVDRVRDVLGQRGGAQRHDSVRQLQCRAPPGAGPGPVCCYELRVAPLECACQK